MHLVAVELAAIALAIGKTGERAHAGLLALARYTSSLQQVINTVPACGHSTGTQQELVRIQCATLRRT